MRSATMTMTRKGPIHLKVEEHGLSALRGEPVPMQTPHRHGEIELNILESGAMTYLFSGQLWTIEAQRIFAFWAGTPHQVIRVEPKTRFMVLTIPTPWVLQWKLPNGFGARFLKSEWLYETVPNDLDVRSMQQWYADITSRNPELRQTALLEIEARIRRLALRSGPADASVKDVHASEIGTVEQMASFIAFHYAKRIGVDEVARAVGLHPNYAMSVFRKGSGTSIAQYILRQRLSHAQRLLATTDLAVDRVAIESGFGSTSRFHEAFKSVVGKTPKRYRADFLSGVEAGYNESLSL